MSFGFGFMREYKILEKNGISVDGVYTKGTKCTKRPKCTKRRSIKREQTKDKKKKVFRLASNGK